MRLLLPCTAFHSCFPQFQGTVSSPPWHEATLALVGTLRCDPVFVQQKSFALFLSLLTIRQMFLYVSCLSQALSLPRQAILSLPCFLIIACALKQTPLQGFSSPLSLPAQSWTGFRGLQKQGCAKKACQGLAKLWGRRQSCMLFQASLILPVSSDVSPFLVTWWLLGPPEPCISDIAIEIYSLCPARINYWLLCRDLKHGQDLGESPISYDCSCNSEKVVCCMFLWTLVFLSKEKEAGHCYKIFWEWSLSDYCLENWESLDPKVIQPLVSCASTWGEVLDYEKYSNDTFPP